MAAKTKDSITSTRKTVKIKRKGKHSKKKSSNLKTSKLYKKKYKGQGR